MRPEILTDAPGDSQACAQRVAIVGMGLTTPLGLTPTECWERLLAAESATDFITRFDCRGLACQIAAEIPQKWLALSDGGDEPVSRGVSLVLRAVQGLAPVLGPALCTIPSARRGMALGGGFADWSEACLADALSRVMTALAQCQAGEKPRERGHCFVHGLRPVSTPLACDRLCRFFMPSGPVSLLYGASASGTQAIIEGAQMIREGRADLVLAAGYDAMIHPVVLRSLDRLGLLSHNTTHPHTASRPFDRTRDGLVVGEGAGLLLLENFASAQARHVDIQGEILGWGMSNSAGSMVAPPPSGSALASAMRQALDSAKLKPEEIDAICAYGNSSVLYDAMETKAIKTVFGQVASTIPASSIKGGMGYLAAAAGPVDVIMSVLALRHQTIPPTLHYAHPDPLCDLDYVPNTPRQKSLRYILINSCGLGGQHAALVLGPPPSRERQGV